MKTLQEFEDVEARSRMEEEQKRLIAAQLRQQTTDTLQQWLAARGFALQETDDSNGYFVKATSVTIHWDNYFANQRAVMYRESPQTIKAKETVKDKLRDVARVLNELDSPWVVDENKHGYLVLVVTISDALKNDLARLQAPPDNPSEDQSVSS